MSRRTRRNRALRVVHALSAPAHCESEEMWPLCRLWILRILVNLGTHSELVRHWNYQEKKLAAALGLPEGGPGDDERKFHRRMMKRLRLLLDRAERSAGATLIPPSVAANLELVSGWAGLDENERLLLLFALAMRDDTHLDAACSLLDNLNRSRTYRALSTILALPLETIRKAFSPGSALQRSALLTLELRDWTLNETVTPLCTGLTELLHRKIRKPEDVLRGLLQTPEPPDLDRSHYPHLEPHLRVLYPYLQRALDQRRRGVNILLYGPPGTGKTQLSRIVGRDLRCALYEVPVEDDDGDPVNGTQRVRAYTAATSLLSTGRNLLVFDELEDIIADDLSRFLSPSNHSQRNKGWLNRALETNPVPTFWISNSVQEFDPALLRRFDLVIEVPVPPASQRERLLANGAPECIPEEVIHRLARVDTLAPAVADRAMRVVASVAADLPEETHADTLETVIEGTLRAQGHAGLAHYDGLEPPRGYDPALSNTDEDLDTLCDGICRARQARLCLYGPPGTGKSAFARHLADRLDAPLLLRRASDLLSPFVGMTEQRIADAFREARREKAVLLIDEADSFLQDRRGAHRSWEITQVNEMLTQMEAFEGVFIVSTNLMEHLDRAALRRFDAKIYFDYLRPEQSWTLLCRACKQLGLGKPAAKLRHRLEELNALTPGDFATVTRRHRLRPFSTPRSLVEALERECAFKEEHRKSPMGFVW